MPPTAARHHLGGHELLEIVVYNPKPYTNACGADVFGAAYNDCATTGQRPPGEPDCPPDTSLYFDCGVQLKLTAAQDVKHGMHTADVVLIGGTHGEAAKAHDARDGERLARYMPDPKHKQPGQIWLWCSKENRRSYVQLPDSVLFGERAIDYVLSYRVGAESPRSLPTTFLSTIFVGDFARTLRPAAPPPARGERIQKLVVMQAKCDGNALFEERTHFIEHLVRELGRERVDSLGKCLHNAEPRFPWLGKPWDKSSLGPRPAAFHANKMDNIEGYAFTLAAESVRTDDWVTEKVYQALAVGSVPVYWGAPNVQAFLPCRHCAIDASRFASARALARHLTYLLHNESAYQEYLAWTRTPYDPRDFAGFERLVRANSFDTTMCRICEKLRPGRCDCARRGCTMRQQDYARMLGKHG